MLIPGSFLRCSQEQAHSAGPWPAPPNAAFRQGVSGPRASAGGSAAFEQRVALPVALGDRRRPKALPRQEERVVGGGLPVAPMVCRVGTGGLGLGAAWQGRCWPPPLPRGGRGAGHHGARTQSRPSSMLRKVQEDGISPWHTLPAAQPLCFPASLPAGTQGRESRGIFSRSSTLTLSPALPSPWSHSRPTARLEEDLLQHWNALQSLPPSLEISGVRGHKAQSPSNNVNGDPLIYTS